MNRFKIGDKVKNTVDYQTFTIKEIKGKRYAVEENVYLWSDEFLIPVEKNKPLKEITEKELLEKELEELKNDVARYFELEGNYQKSLHEYHEMEYIKNKIIKAGKEE